MQILQTLKELRLFIGVIASFGGLSIFHWDEVLNYIYTYNIHLGVITAIGYMSIIIYLIQDISELRFNSNNNNNK